MDIRYQVVVIDAADVESVSSFWAGVFGGSVDRDDGFTWSSIVAAPHASALNALRTMCDRNGPRPAINSSNCISISGSRTSTQHMNRS